MEATEFIARAKRDTQVIEALKGALEAMALTHGTRIAMVGMEGVLNYKAQISKIMVALALLGVDSDRPPPYDANDAPI